MICSHTGTVKETNVEGHRGHTQSERGTEPNFQSENHWQRGWQIGSKHKKLWTSTSTLWMCCQSSNYKVVWQCHFRVNRCHSRKRTHYAVIEARNLTISNSFCIYWRFTWCSVSQISDSTNLWNHFKTLLIISPLMSTGFFFFFLFVTC